MKKLVPLSGIGALVLVFASFFVVGETPDTDAPLPELVTFYTDHDSDLQIGGFLVGIGAFLFLVFSTTLAGALRRAQGETGAASALSFGGGVVFAVGLAIFAGLNFVLGDTVDDIGPGSLQTLHVLSEDFFAPFALGMLTWLIGTGAGIVKTDVLPKWLGWVAIVTGVFAFSPLFPIAALGTLLVLVVGGVMLAMKADTA